MPKLRATPEQREINRFNGWVNANLSARKLKKKDLAEPLGVSRGAITQRFNGETKWTLPDIFKVCEFFGEEYTVGEVK